VSFPFHGPLFKQLKERNPKPLKIGVFVGRHYSPDPAEVKVLFQQPKVLLKVFNQSEAQRSVEGVLVHGNCPEITHAVDMALLQSELLELRN
jgi:hypothetical protein